MAVSSTLTIGNFSRATQLSVKTLRHYHDVGLLEPVDVDADTGYRRYATDQIVTAQIIRRFRDLDMPLGDIHAVLEAPDLETRNLVIAKHLDRLESNLTRTQEAVSSLRDLLDHPQATSSAIHHRYLPATSAAVITDIVDKGEAATWFHGAMAELAATLAAQDIGPSGPAGGVYESEFFTDDRGRATVFYPCALSSRPVGRVITAVIPPAEVAMIVHTGPHADFDRAYGALGAYVTQHALAVDGPIREYYLVGPVETRDESLWRTEVGWPIFETRPKRD